MRLHGFQYPFSKLQVFAWAYVGACVFCFFGMVLPCFEKGAVLLGGGLYVAAIVGTLVFNVLCTASNPTDKAIYRYIQALKAG